MESKNLIYQLPNGLTVLGEKINWVKGASIGFFVNTGARDETEAESGVSHFLEHMLFKGTSKRDSLKLSFDIGAIGAKANAYTSEENTVYYASVIGNYVPSMQEILSDMLRPSLSNEDFELERKVILEEIALYQDRPQFWLFEQATRHFYENHPAGNSVLGSTESISALTVQQMKDYFNRRYSPSNMVLVATGNINWDQICADADEYCQSWTNHSTTRVKPPHTRVGEQITLTRADLSQAHILFISPGCSKQDEDRYSLLVLATIIGDSMGSKMYWDLIDTGLADSAGCDSENRDEVGAFSLYAATRPQDLDKVRDIILRIIAEKIDFTEEELTRAKNKLLSSLVFSSESTMGRMISIAQSWIYHDKFHKIEDSIQKVSAVNRHTILRSLEKYPLNDWCEYHLLPQT